MAEIRLNKIIRTYNIGLQKLVDFLASKGVEVEANPNVKISEDLLPAIDKQFGMDKAAKQASEKIDIKLNEILEKTSKKQQQESQKEEDEEEPVRETVIKTTIFTPAEPKPEPEVVRQPEPESQPEVKPEPVQEPEVKVPEVEPMTETVPEPAKAEPVHESPVEEEPKKEAAEKKPEPQPEVKKPEAVKETVPEPTTPAAGKDVHGGDRPMSKHERKLAAAARQKEEQAKAKHQQPVAKTETKEEKPAAESSTPGLKVLGKIDLSQFEPKKGNKKRERIAKGSQKVDVAKEGKQADNSSRKDKNKNAKQAQEQGKGGKKRNRGADRFKPAMTEEEQEAMQKEIQKQVKETYARMNDNKKNNFGAKYRKEKREQAAAKSQEEMAQEIAEKKVLKVTEFVTVNDLATLMNNTPVNEVIKACMDLGLMVSINQRLDAEALVLVAEQFGYKVEFVTADLTEEIAENNEQADREEDLVPRPPIITVMGHVDHGKTSLLDYIRKSNVIAGEAGGITQHIGAYNVKLPDGRRITFLDTPGHEAFTAMRARGAQLTDLAIIIIAADDAVMPQTVEAINHAQAAGVPMVFAINKIDKPGAQPERIYQQLAQMNILTEAWGGKYQCQEISAKKGINVDKLLEKVLLETDLLDLKANPNKNGVGAVIESSLDKGRGYLATVLVQDGTLRTGDMVLSGSYYGRVKAMFNERGQKVKEAGPSTPVSILGLNGAPSAGDKFNVMSDEKEAKAIANKREQLLRIQGIKTQKHMTLEEIGRRIAIGNFKELNVIVKGDVDGSVEALSDSLIKLSTEQVRVNVIHKAVGAISESDVILAEASDAVIIGFQVRPSTDARKLADEQGIEIRLYSVIYDAINDVKDGIEGMLEPIKKEEITGTAEVKQTFKISKVGTIAGCLVRDGKISKTSQCRLIRDGIVVYTGELASLKRGKDDVKEVSAGMECGIGIEKFNDLKVGDSIEAFVITEIKQKLD
ncbi:MAG TPA: translation initiation factor IF-2 [Rikenellaceae bacterium]|nr:translation initiation factor IF-2 [Rikenellaceae bacterium]